MPASPPRFGALARVHGLMTQLSRHHDLTGVMLVPDEFDAEECRGAMRATAARSCWSPPYVERPRQALLQLRSLASTRLRALQVAVPAMEPALDRVLRAKRSTSSTWSSCSLATVVCVRPARREARRPGRGLAQHRLRSR